MRVVLICTHPPLGFTEPFHSESEKPGEPFFFFFLKIKLNLAMLNVFLFHLLFSSFHFLGTLSVLTLYRNS